MQRLLASAVADPSVTVRYTILNALSHTAALESHLAQAEALRSLFVALNDESSRVRSLTIKLAGAISHTNPAYVMPALRRHLMQLLSDMDHSPDSRQREGGAAATAPYACIAAALRSAHAVLAAARSNNLAVCRCGTLVCRECSAAGCVDRFGAQAGASVHSPCAACARQQAASRGI